MRAFHPLLGLLACALALSAACASSPPSTLPSAAELGRARALVAAMDLEARAGQVLLIGVGGRGEAPAPSLAILRELRPGGILLFGFNIPPRPFELRPALEAFQTEARAVEGGLPLLVAIDHEGGSVFRFKGGITRPPAPLETARRGQAYARLLGEREALELGDLGIDMVLGPLVEPLTADNEAFLGNRSFGRDPARVDAIAGAYIQGLAAGGAMAVAKHFPADGPADPHRSLPRLTVPLAGLERDYLPRFAAAIGAGAPAVMLSHVLVEAVDPGRPGSLSPKVLELLRGDLGFRGLVLTDDLLMKAIAGSPKIAAVKALAAGADLLMLSTEDAGLPVRDAIVEAVRGGILPAARLEEAAVRVVAQKLALEGARARIAAGEGGGEGAPSAAGFEARVAESAALLEAASRGGR